MARLRVGVLGLSHDHVWGNLAALAEGDVGDLVVASDPDPDLRDRLARSLTIRRRPPRLREPEQERRIHARSPDCVEVSATRLRSLERLLCTSSEDEYFR